MDASGWRVPADRLEKIFAEVAAKRFEETGFAIRILDAPTAVEIEKIRRGLENICFDLRDDGRNAMLAEIVAGGSLSPDALAIELRLDAISRLLQLPADRFNLPNLSIVASWRIRRRGVETRFSIGGESVEVDQALYRRSPSPSAGSRR